MTLEERVASLYRALEYEVRRDVQLSGSQIDVLAVKMFPGYGRVRIAVEVKDYPKRSVPIDEVRQFVNVAKLLLDAKTCDRAVMVTSGAFTRNSRSAVENTGHVELLTFADLEREVLASDATLVRWLCAHNEAGINRRYVDLKATLLDIDAPAGVEAPGRVLASSLIDIALANPDSAVFVFGDYGAGKTTVLERLKARAIERRQEDGNAVVPVFIPLKSMSEGMDAERLVALRLPTELGVSLPPQVFWDLHAAGRFLLLLDGFDEITLRADADKRTQLLTTLSPLLFGPSPAILTSRPSYFASTKEYREALALLRVGGRRGESDSTRDLASQRVVALANRLAARYREAGPLVPRSPNYVSYELDPLTSEQIDEFLEASRSLLQGAGVDDPADVRRFLSSIYDLSDLITRPIILDMAVATIEDGSIDIRRETLANGPAGLYDAYTSSKLQADYEKAPSRREFLSHDERMAFAELCAAHMAQTDQLWVDENELGRLAREALNSSDAPIDEVLTDLRTCSFLTVDAEGSLQFVHRSFQEYFFARKLRTELLAGRPQMLGSADRWEYLYFLGAFAYTDNDFYNTLFELARAGDRRGRGGPVADNAARAYLAARESTSAVNWRLRRIGRLARTRLSIRRAELVETAFDELDVGRLEISESTLDVVVDSVGGGQILLRDCNGKAALHGDIGQVEIEGGTLTVDDTSDANVAVRDAHVQMRVARDTGRYRCSIERSTGKLTTSSVELDLRCSTLYLDAHGRVDGDVADSRLQVRVEALDRLATTTRGSTILVNGGERSGAAGKVRGAVHDCLVVVSADIKLGAWWRHQQNVILIGGHVERPPNRWPSFEGLTFAGEELPKVGDDPMLRTQTHGDAVVIEGRGAPWQEARALYRTALDTLKLEDSPEKFIASLRRVMSFCNVEPSFSDRLLREIELRWRGSGAQSTR